MLIPRCTICNNVVVNIKERVNDRHNTAGFLQTDRHDATGFLPTDRQDTTGVHRTDRHDTAVFCPD